MKKVLSEEQKAKRLAYYHANKTAINEKKKEWRKNNRKQINEYHKLKCDNDPLYKLRYKVRTLIKESFRKSNVSKSNSTEQILGCSHEQFKQYLESKFEPWMNWQNRGLYNGTPNYGWDIDHIIPLKTAKTVEDLIRLNHYTNLQPLCSYVNRDVKK